MSGFTISRQELLGSPASFCWPRLERLENRQLLAADITTGLQLYYSFENDTPSSFIDESGLNRHGSEDKVAGGTGVAAINDGAQGKAIRFNGDSRIVVDGYKGVSGGQERTVAFWMRSVDASNGPAFVTWGKGGAHKRYSLRFDNAKPRLVIQSGVVGTTQAVDTTAWTHLAYVSRGGTNATLATTEIYVNGQAVQLGGHNGAAFNTEPTFDVEIGSFNGGRYLDGELDELRVYDRALDPGDVLELAGGANDAPPNANGETINGTEDVLLNGTVAGNDTDPEGATLTYNLVSGPANGNLTLNGDGTFSYDPDTDFNGSDTFTYTVSDGSLTSTTVTATLVIAVVADAPTAGPDIFTTAEDTPLNGTVAGNDTDPDGDSLTYTLIRDVGQGSLTLNGDGTFRYEPAANFNGVDSFRYRISDGDPSTADAEAEVTLNVSNVANPPTATGETLNGTEDTLLTGTVAGNESDPDGDTLVYTVLTPPASGTLNLASDGTLTFDPAADFNGTLTFTYNVSDGNAATADAQATATLVLAAVNDAPDASADGFRTSQDVPITDSVATNDSDVEGQTLTYELVQGTTNGTVTLNSNGTFTYGPDVAFSGSDTFTYSVTDGTGTSEAVVTLTVEAQPPANSGGSGSDSDGGGQTGGNGDSGNAGGAGAGGSGTGGSTPTPGGGNPAGPVTPDSPTDPTGPAGPGTPNGLTPPARPAPPTPAPASGGLAPSAASSRGVPNSVGNRTSTIATLGLADSTLFKDLKGLGLQIESAQDLGSNRTRGLAYSGPAPADGMTLLDLAPAGFLDNLAAELLELAGLPFPDQEQAADGERTDAEDRRQAPDDAVPVPAQDIDAPTPPDVLTSQVPTPASEQSEPVDAATRQPSGEPAASTTATAEVKVQERP